MSQSGVYLADPVDAYDQIAPFFRQLAERRRKYLQSIEDLLVARIAPGSQSLLDVGAADGERAASIASRCGIRQVVLLEPSAEMRKRALGSTEMWGIRAEDLTDDNPETDRHFDTITCLWNVLGHIRPDESRVHALTQLARRLTPAGILFLDVNHRYNVRSYGLIKTGVRFVGDNVFPGERRGDVTVSWAAGGNLRRTYGHVFTHGEVMDLARRSGLSLQERIVVDYDDGQIRCHAFQGNLFYVFRARSSERAAFSAPQTSSTPVSIS